MRKKIVLFLLISLSLFLSACVKNNKDNSIKISNINFNDYFIISITMYETDKYVTNENETWYGSVTTEINIRPLNQNLTYENISVNINVSGVMDSVKEPLLMNNKYTKTYKVLINNEGFGKANKSIPVKAINKENYATKIVYYGYEIIKASGYIKTPS